MQRERLFEIAKEAGFERIQECCPGVAYKLCSNDVWKGNLAALIEPIAQEIRQEDQAKKSAKVAEPEVSISDYKALLEHSYAMSKINHGGCPPESRLEFLGDQLFDFTTYDSEISEKLAHVAVLVCHAITTKTTFDFIKDPGLYMSYLTMCNMPFFAEKLEWGTSIRGAWWDSYSGITITSSGLYIEEDQLLSLTLRTEEWDKFMVAVIEFAAPEMHPESDGEVAPS